MTNPVQFPKYSLGVGDRFAHQARVQLQAFLLAKQESLEIVPVCNKSNREHTIIGFEPSGTCAAANEAVQSLDWREPYFVDADHINLKTVDRFLQPCDFFTLDVADRIGQPADGAAVKSFIDQHPELIGAVTIPPIARSFQTDRLFVDTVIDIDPARLPTPDTLNQWSAEQLVAALRHDPRNPAYNPHMRQLLHVGFKVAAKMRDLYLDLLKAAENTVAKNITGNLFNRHIKPLFLGN